MVLLAAYDRSSAWACELLPIGSNGCRWLNQSIHSKAPNATLSAVYATDQFPDLCGSTEATVGISKADIMADRAEGSRISG